MPCIFGKDMRHELLADELRKSQCSLQRPIQAKIDEEMKKQRLEYQRIMKHDCKDVYKERGINTADIKKRIQQRQESEKVQRQLAYLPSTESTTATGRNAARRLRQKEDTIRNRLKSQKEPVVTQRDFERLQDAAKVVTVDDRLSALAKVELETNEMQDEYERTRSRFKTIDDRRRRALNSKVKADDLWGADDKAKVLDRAFLAKHEQEEEIKQINHIILNAKCHAVRDAQIHEKNELERELREEEGRLERMVTENALKSIAQEDNREEMQREIKAKYAREIREQLSERETIRFLEAERISQEAKLLRQANEAIKRDEERQQLLARERRAQFRNELSRVIEMSNLFKKMLCEQERETDMRIAAYMKQKLERERALSAERKVNKEATERNQQRIYNLAQKILESKSQREEMGYLREQERIEREYRRKEKEAVMRKKQIEKELADARDMQLQETKYRQALQVAREEKDFNSLIEALKSDQEKQRKQDELREQKRRLYRSEIIRQMGDKEIERRRLKELELDQAAAWRESERQRDTNIQTVINSKLQAMRDACLPEKYIRDVELQMEKIKHSKNRL